MGCCLSRTLDDDSFENDDTPIPRGGNKPFTKKGVTWMSETPITTRQLKKQRDAFWDTAPSYEGRIEIWQALRCACECNDLELAQAVLGSANITIPTGNLVDGCYDELGNRYAIPAYCLVEPTNLLKGNYDEGTSDCIDELNSEFIAEQAAATERSVTIRLSNTAKDVKINIRPHTDTFATLRIKLCADQGLDVKKFNIRFFFLGSLLDDRAKLTDIKCDDEQVLQALISEKQ